jgi:hypothetical protein
MSAEPARDPFEDFAEQEMSWSAIRKYRDQLVAMAKKLYAMDPDLGAAGLVLLAGSRISKALAQAAPPGQQPDPERQDCVTAMPRADFEHFIKTFAPQAGSLPEPDPSWQRTGRTMPILVETRNGARLAGTTFDVD